MAGMTDCMRLPGGADLGAIRVGDTVVRAARPWNGSVQRLLEHLSAKGFTGSPRPLGVEGPHERLTYLDGETIGDVRPWPPFVHSDEALVGVARWLRSYHEAVADFVDWDMAGPRSVVDDVAWVAFSWVPLHARSLVEAEGFREFGRRPERLEMFLEAYEWEGGAGEWLAILDRVLAAQIGIMHTRATGGDPAYERMLELGRHEALADARTQLRVLGAEL